MSLYQLTHFGEAGGKKEKQAWFEELNLFFWPKNSVQLIPAEAASKVRWSEDDIKSRLKLETGYILTFFLLSRHALLYCHLEI